MSNLPNGRRRILILAAVVIATGIVVTIAKGNANRAGIVGLAVGTVGLIALLAFRSLRMERQGQDRLGRRLDVPITRRQKLTAGILIVLFFAAVILIPEDRLWTVPAFVIFAVCILGGSVRRRQ